MKYQEIIVEGQYRPQPLFSPVSHYAVDVASYLQKHAQPWLKSTNNGRDFRMVNETGADPLKRATPPTSNFKTSFFDALVNARGLQPAHANSYYTFRPKKVENRNVLVPLGDFTYTLIDTSFTASYVKSLDKLLLEIFKDPASVRYLLNQLGLSTTSKVVWISRLVNSILKNPALYKKHFTPQDLSYALRMWARKSWANRELLRKHADLIPKSAVSLVDQPASIPIPTSKNSELAALIHTNNALVMNHSFYVNFVLPILEKKSK